MTGVLMGFNLKDREIKLIYLLIFTLFIISCIRIFSSVVPQTANAKQEFLAKKLEKDYQLQKIQELDELIAKNMILENQLKELKNRFVLEAEDAALVLAQGQGTNVIIKSITPKDVSANEFYYINSYTIEIQGIYADIVNFISELEKKPVSRVVEVNLKLNRKEKNVDGSIVWDMYTLNERKLDIIPTVSVDHGRTDPFKVPDAYLNFVFVDETNDLTEEIQHFDEVFLNKTSDNEPEDLFLYENRYRLPIKH